MSVVASIIIPVLNGAGTIGDTLRALAAQSGVPHEVEIIVVDNGSTDDTVGIVSRFPVRLAHCAVRGISAARNEGLRQSAGPIVLSIDADTLPARNWLREILTPFLRDETLVLAGGRTLSFRPETGAQRFIEQAGLFAPENNVLNAHFPFAIGGHLAVRREAAMAIGGWDESLSIAEDVDFSTRLIAHTGTRLRYLDRAVLFHRNRPDDADLVRQASGYGRGLASIYRRYPERVGWNLRMHARIRWMILSRSLRPEWLRLARALGRCDEASLEFARYQRMWCRAFWSGFFRELRPWSRSG